MFMVIIPQPTLNGKTVLESNSPDGEGFLNAWKQEQTSNIVLCNHFLCQYVTVEHTLNQGRETDMNACNLTVAVTALANTIACGLTAEETGFVGALLVQLGDTLATIAAQRALCEAKCKD